MFRDKVSSYTKAAVIFLGAVCLLAALATLSLDVFKWKFFLILAFAVTIAPRMSLTLPRSKFAISFSDALVFLTLLLYGGQAAVIVSLFETTANCIFLRSRGFRFGRLMIPTNISLNIVATTITYFLWTLIQNSLLGPTDITRTQHLITALGILALIQFLGSSLLAAAFQSLKDGSNPWETWKRDCFTSSMTQIVGAGIAGLVYKLINFGDIVTAAIASIALAIAFVNYRQSIAEINRAIENVEEAERQKAEAERGRRREAEKYAQELASSLEKEARANDALRRSEKDLQFAALHDSLTGLANRKKLNEILHGLIQNYKDDPSTNFQVLFLDIRSFKNINDTLGHTIGDKVLSIAAKRFTRIVNPEDTVARIGGDEFAIILRNLATAGKAQKVARKIHRSITQPFSLSGNKISIDVNIGIAPCDAEYETPEEILRDADIAMHYAKERNDGPAVFTKELRHRFLERVRFEMDLRHAIERNEFAMSYQPIVSLSDGRLVGFEALLRWNHSELGLIPPSKFIPIAESSDLIQPITVWILQETTRQIAEWQQISPDYRNLVVSVNISGKHLSNDNLVDEVEAALDASGIDPATLKLEITESSAMENAERTINLLKRLKAIGVRLSIDDFGTGYSSLSYLHRLPFDTLKIDRSFVKNVGEHGENSGILQTIISLAKNLKMRVVAEGIETEAQLAVLQNLGCDYGQGYLLAKPKGRDETERRLYQHPIWLPSDRVTEIRSIGREHVVEDLPVF
ncbi:MAG: bifunctional diguanylate cyclase/phosphodiesterase [Pyrinomonadaceae bacterium]|nr:bifunctional diguanylate cyclase/phosphodiesterase [Pyrinomonadaceae bacterium]